jgi:hypothetical protein
MRDVAEAFLSSSEPGLPDWSNFRPMSDYLLWDYFITWIKFCAILKNIGLATFLPILSKTDPVTLVGTETSAKTVLFHLKFYGGRARLLRETNLLKAFSKIMPI